MYQLVNARYRTDRRVGRWVEGDLSAAKAVTLATTHGDIFLYITYAGLAEPKALRFSKVTNLLAGVSADATVQQWLTGLGNRSLPFESTTPTFSPRYVHYIHAWHAGYDIQAIARNGTLGAGGSSFHKEDLLLRHPKFTPEWIATQALITVNGYFHLCDHNEDGVRIYGGNHTLRKKNDNQIGIYSFEQVGALRYCPITADMLQRQNDNSAFYDATYITIPDSYDLQNKTVLLVMGGHLQVLDRTYLRTGERTWRVLVPELMHPDRWFEAGRNLNLDSLNLPVYEPNPSLITVEMLKSDAVVQGYLTLPQSFFVIVDSETFFHEILPLEAASIPQRYLDDRYDKYPVMGAYGKMLDYHVIQEDVFYVYCTSENIRHNYDFAKRRWTREETIDAGRYPADPYRHAEAWLRIMGSEL